jgi:steroid delta-isomerase-like uncharacterized protein
MSAENKAVFQKFVDSMNAKDADAIGQLMSANFIDHDLPPGQEPGVEGMLAMMRGFFAGFPDLKITINQLIAEGDLVVAAMTTEGTQTGEFMGVPASGKKISITEMHMVRVVDGKAVEHWGVADAMGMMQQLGVTPQG